ncbi:hypothetical protein [Streptomyces globisporus]|uniref:hypothetical protein n=1 Tax=Streptomyces globisporus TaxID=1908 RepID=UPI003817F879
MRRLRRRITLLFALTSAVGLVAMAAWAVRGDDVRRRDQLDRTMSADTNWALGLLETDEDGRLDAGVLLDTAGTACSPLHLLSVPPDAARDARRIAPADLAVEHAPRGPFLTADGPAVRRAAAAAVNADEERSLDGRPTTGEPVRLFALPFYPPEAEEGRR